MSDDFTYKCVCRVVSRKSTDENYAAPRKLPIITGAYFYFVYMMIFKKECK